jgi:hypothetical protein
MTYRMACSTASAYFHKALPLHWHHDPVHLG